MKKLIIILIIIITVSNAQAQYSGGNGTQNNPYQIANVSDLVKLCNTVNAGNTYTSTYFLMTSDVDLTSINGSWIPISRFNGTFDGDNYSINLAIFSINSNNIGLFGQVMKNGVIQNVNIKSGNISSLGTFAKSNIGAIAGTNLGTIRHCSNKIDVINNSDRNEMFVGYATGGIVGRNYGTISDCCNMGNISNDNFNSSNIGGIAGFDSTGTVTNCYNSGEISANSMAGVGGIIGTSFHNNISKCVNKGNIVIGSNTVICTGGVVGCANMECNVSDCHNVGNVKILHNLFYIAAGGIIGDFTDTHKAILNNCYNLGDISASQANSGYAINLGGIVGGLAVNTINNFNVTINNSYNAGRVSGYNAWQFSSTGGIIGGINGGDEYINNLLSITNCYNIAEIQGGYAGGIMGTRYDNIVTIDNCYYLSGAVDDGVGNGSNNGIATKTSTAMKDTAFINTLNNGQIPVVWSQDTVPLQNNGYPILPFSNTNSNNNANIIASASGGGFILPSGIVSIAPCAPESVTFTMLPNACNRLVDVLVNGVSIGAVDNYTFPAGKTGTIKAIFESGDGSIIYASAATYLKNKPTKLNYIYEIGNKPKLRMKLRTNAHTVNLPKTTEIKINFNYCNALAWLQTKSLKLLGLNGWTIVDTMLTEDFNTLTSNYSITISNPNGLLFTDSVDVFDIEFLLTFPMKDVVPQILDEYYTMNIKPVLYLNSLECLEIDTAHSAKINIKPVCESDLRYFDISDTPIALGYNSTDNIINYSIPFDCNAYLTIYNILGKTVTSTEPTYMKRGIYEMDMNNIDISTGTYFCELRIDGINNKIISFPYMKR